MFVDFTLCLLILISEMNGTAQPDKPSNRLQSLNAPEVAVTKCYSGLQVTGSYQQGNNCAECFHNMNIPSHFRLVMSVKGGDEILPKGGRIFTLLD